MILLDALNLNPTPRRPVWIMRQAGRYMKAFRDVRAKHRFLEICDSVELSVEVTWLPLKAYDLDAAIVFSDILLPLRAHGVSVEFGEEGPVIGAPQSVADFQKLKKEFDPEEATPTILSALKELRRSVPKEKAVLGFAGAPFTLLTYMLEGKLSKDLSTVKRWIFSNPALAHEWLEALSNSTAKYLEAQVEAGADAVQLFDTWASALSPEAYSEFALPYARKVLSQVTAPTLYYVNGISGILEQAANVGAQGLGIDWRLPLSLARQRVSQTIALQGNLDPHELFLPKGILRQRVLSICESYGRSPGHIFNLGHGITPGAPEDSVKVLIDAVHEFRLTS